MKSHPKKSKSFRARANPLPFCGNGICFVLGNDNRESSQKNNYHHRHIKRSWGRGSFTILGKAPKKWRNWENSTTWKRYKGQHSFLLLWKVRELLKRVNKKNERRATRRKSTECNQVDIVQRTTLFLPPSKVKAHGKANLWPIETTTIPVQSRAERQRSKYLQTILCP